MVIYKIYIMRPTATMCSYFGWLVQFGISSVINATISPNIYLPDSTGRRFERTGSDCDVTILTHWGRVTHICVGKLNIIASNNSLSPGQRQAIIRTSAAILLTGPLETNLSEVSIGSSNIFYSSKCIWKSRLQNGVHFLSASMCWFKSTQFHPGDATKPNIKQIHQMKQRIKQLE